MGSRNFPLRDPFSLYNRLQLGTLIFLLHFYLFALFTFSIPSGRISSQILTIAFKALTTRVPFIFSNGIFPLLMIYHTQYFHFYFFLIFSPSYEFMFACKRCAPGCDVCRDDSPCLSTYDWGFRISLLTITVLCIGFVFVLGVNIYRYRRLKVIKVASPIFLCITLLGCAIMYCEVRFKSLNIIFKITIFYL